MLRALLEVNMSWQERVERYKQEQTQLQNEAERKLQEQLRVQQEGQKLTNIELIKPLLQVLENLECRKALTGIRDEIWKLGEVTVSPNLSMFTHETPIEATASLVASLGCSEGIYEEYNSEESVLRGYYWNPEGERKSLQIKFYYAENKATTRRIKISVISSGYVWTPYSETDFDEESNVWLEKALLKDCVMRKDLSYDEAARKAQRQYDEAVRKDRKHYYTWERRK